MRKRDQRGFSLTELITVIGIMVVLAAVALPLISGIMPGVRLREGGQQLYQAMLTAKMEAIKRNQNVWVEVGTKEGVSYEIKYSDPINKKEVTLAQGNLPQSVVAEAKDDVFQVTFKGNGILKGATGDTLVLRSSRKKNRTLSLVVNSQGGVRLTSK